MMRSWIRMHGRAVGALNRLASGYRAWLEQSVLPQPDGSYLVRPLGRRLVYQVDAAAKDDFLKFANRIALIGFAVLVAVLLLPNAAWQYGRPPLDRKSTR